MGKVFFNGRFQPRRFKAKRPQATGIDHPPIQPNKVKARRHSCIRLADRVVHSVHISPDAIPQGRLASPGDRLSFLGCLRVIHIGRSPGPPELQQQPHYATAKPPPIHRVRFPNIDHQELQAVVMLPVEVVETHGPVCERRSGVAAEYQCHGFSTSVVGQSNRVLAIHITQLEIRGNISRLGCMGLEPFLPGSMLSPISHTFQHQGTVSCALPSFISRLIYIHIKPMLYLCQIIITRITVHISASASDIDLTYVITSHKLLAAKQVLLVSPCPAMFRKY